MTCRHCGRPYDPVRFPLARPRRDGTRHPMRYCDSCLALPWRRGGGHEALLVGKRAYRLRMKAYNA